MSVYVLLFHSVDDRPLSSLKGLGNIHPIAFERMMRGLKRDFDVVDLRDLVGRLSSGEAGRERLLAVTFDDGPKSYAANAVPLFETLVIPSTCFIISDCIGDRQVYWRYLFNFCLNEGHEEALGRLLETHYGEAVPKGGVRTYSRRVFSPEKTARIIEAIHEEIVSEVEYRERERNLFLSFEDVAALKDHPLVRFGIHTRTHPVMAVLDDGAIRDEIEGSMDFYRSHVADDAPMFSVPFGRLFVDYDERTVRAARDLGIPVVLSAYGGSNQAGQPLCNVRRVPVTEEMMAEGEGGFIRSVLESRPDAEYAAREERLAELLSWTLLP